MVTDVRKADLGIGGIISEGWRHFSENFKVLTLLILTIYVPIAIVSYIRFIQITDSDLHYTISDVNIVIFVYAVLVFFLVIATFIFSSAVIIVISESTKGKKITYNEALVRGWKRFPHLFVTSILMSIFLFLLFIAFFVPGVIFFVFWVFAVYASVLNKKIGMGALSHSFNLVKGRWWKTLGYIIVFWALSFPVMLVFIAVNAVLYPIIGDVSMIFQNILAGFVGAFFTSIFTIFFLNFEANPVNKIRG